MVKAQKKENKSNQEEKIRRKRTMIGVVSSDKMQKTVTVTVTRRVKDAKFEKYLTRVGKFKAHSENNEAKIGDKVLIIESRPLSKDKRWRVQKILEKVRQAD